MLRLVEFSERFLLEIWEFADDPPKRGQQKFDPLPWCEGFVSCDCTLGTFASTWFNKFGNVFILVSRSRPPATPTNHNSLLC
jgi:hypothetical protein